MGNPLFWPWLGATVVAGVLMCLCGFHEWRASAMRRALEQARAEHVQDKARIELVCGALGRYTEWGMPEAIAWTEFQRGTFCRDMIGILTKPKQENSPLSTHSDRGVERTRAHG